jgi:hypothetical protein
MKTDDVLCDLETDVLYIILSSVSLQMFTVFLGRGLLSGALAKQL